MASKTRRPPPPMTPKGVATPRRKAPTSKAVNKAALENFDIEGKLKATPS
jgi:hypothetical protein